MNLRILKKKKVEIEIPCPRKTEDWISDSLLLLKYRIEDLERKQLQESGTGALSECHINVPEVEEEEKCEHSNVVGNPYKNFNDSFCRDCGEKLIYRKFLS